VILVGVIGATGRVGAEVCRAVHADADMELVAGISRSKAGEKASEALGLDGSDMVLAENLDSFVEAKVEVAVDFTGAEWAPEHIEWAIEHGVHIVVGTTGFEVDEGWREAPVGVFVAPNFAIGAALMQRFAAQAARYLPAVEIVELHHDGKADAPSGTAAATADAVPAPRPPPPRSLDRPVVRVRSGSPGRRTSGHPDPFDPAARPGRTPRGDLRGPGPDAHDPPRLHRPHVVRAGRLDGDPVGPVAPRAHRGARRAPRSIGLCLPRRPSR
jgi:4-hydroxy-tetrahydrodipicolinate reductase